jgi:hypothetical protein
VVGNVPWLIVGDFNVIRSQQEKWGISSFTCYEQEFVECHSHLEVEDLAFIGAFHTWSNKQVGEDFVSKKLDRVLSNFEWLNLFGNTAVTFLEGGISDHSAALVTVEDFHNFGPKPFKFFNFWTEHRNSWSTLGMAGALRW